MKPIGPREPSLRQQIVEICHRMYRQGYIAAGDGNVSARLDAERIMVTPSGFHKGFIQPENLIIVDLSGKKLKGNHQPSSEFAMHRAAYQERPEIAAVVHGHPPLTVGLALAGVSMAQCILSETCLVLGPILTAPYTTPTTDEVPNTLRPYLRQANAIVLDRHGAVTVGRNLDEAYNRMEAMEHASKITQAARAIGPITPLSESQAAKLEDLARQFGIARPPDPCTLCNACPKGQGGPIQATSISAEDSTEILVQAVLRKIRGHSP